MIKDEVSKVERRRSQTDVYRYENLKRDTLHEVWWMLDLPNVSHANTAAIKDYHERQTNLEAVAS